MYQSVSVVVMVAMLVLVPVDSFEWTQCAPRDTVVIHRLDISPNPVQLGQPIRLSIEAHILKTINNSEIHIEMKRKIAFFHIKVPCLFHYGSCTFKESCPMMYRLNLNCPLHPQIIKINNHEMKMDNMSGFSKGLLRGNYNIKVTMIDKQTKKTNLCLKMKMSIH